MNKSTKTALVLGLLAALAAPLAEPLAAAPAPDKNWTIVPGASLGKIRLGQDEDSLERVMPDPTSSDCGMGKCWLTWFSAPKSKAKRQRVDVYQSRNFGFDNDRARIREIRATSPSFRTVGGTSTANSWSSIQRYYPNLKWVAYYPSDTGARIDIYDDVQQGIAFEVTAKTSNTPARCVAIIVHRKGHGVGQEYLALHEGLKFVGRPSPANNQPVNEHIPNPAQDGHGY